jgi:hypothetical protein
MRNTMKAVLVLERELPAANGEEHAVPLDFPGRWDIGAPLPHAHLASTIRATEFDHDVDSW